MAGMGGHLAPEWGVTMLRNIHQSHVRPIVRGKTNSYVEFGTKIKVSLMNGFAFLDDF